ncbi:uncharacterized protein N7482_000236 [Penicillium canariense]|uniref:Uncharacterized protein n=1 Tax=Penicillium canariense TaxID=189055 RepID=A0A9W9IDT2_9EURO|nr:uncharacterized protein N7482_000236 [Penicillium canariense]KAJ5174359.1 hypothetical protein N7482_000236 [Penicillium canariense]
MEYIEIDHTASDAQRAKALAEIVSIKPPFNATPGPIGGGRIYMHTFWQRGGSDMEYTSVQALESHINRVLEVFKMPQQEQHEVNFRHERMLCCYTAIHKPHFLVDADDQLWVVAFSQFNVLPESFMDLALRMDAVERRSPPTAVSWLDSD